jgi:hypothetical protein
MIKEYEEIHKVIADIGELQSRQLLRIRQEREEKKVQINQTLYILWLLSKRTGGKIVLNRHDLSDFDPFGTYSYTVTERADEGTIEIVVKKVE